MAESLLFGHAKGAFTGATRSTDGFFTQAQGGTLFLDEIGELTLPLQAKLLRAIQEKEVLPVGSSQTQRVDVRIVGATNRDLRAAIRAGYFREDLYFRISTFRINVPGLASRLDDILPLANYFLLKHGREEQALQLSPEASAKLLAYSWPGNVRELENVIQRAIVLTNDGMINSAQLIFDEPSDHLMSTGELPPRHSMSNVHALDAGPQGPARWSDTNGMPMTPFSPQMAAPGSAYDYEGEQDSAADSAAGLQSAMDANEFRIIVDTIKNTRTRQEAAKILGISQRTLRYKIARMRERGIAIPKRRTA